MRFEVSTTFHGMQGHPSPAEVLPYWGGLPILATTEFTKPQTLQVLE